MEVLDTALISSFGSIIITYLLGRQVWKSKLIAIGRNLSKILKESTELMVALNALVEDSKDGTIEADKVEIVIAEFQDVVNLFKEE